MDLNSPLFDKIRTRPKEPREEASAPSEMRCDAPGCDKPGAYRAPMGRLREGQYFCFCLDHVREYNATYNYFNGMNDTDVARYVKDATVGHRPTWAMGTKRGAASFREDAVKTHDPLGIYRQRFRRREAAAPKREPRYSPVTLRALTALDLDETADAAAIRARYKELVKRHHPDANGGDRSREEKLREIIHAYKTLRAAKLV